MNEKKTDDDVPCCANCFFSEETGVEPVALVDADPETTLLCRRYPPFVVQAVRAMTQSMIASAWPPVLSGDWCGEHKPVSKPLLAS